MIAIFVMATIGAMALGSYGRSVQRAKVERSASRLSHQLKSARAEAISLNRDVRVSLSTSGRTLTIWTDNNRDKTQDSDEFEVVSLGEATEIRLTSTWTEAWFSPLGEFVATRQSRTLGSKQTTISSLNGSDSAIVTIRGGGSIQVAP